ncbi:MAG: hypothetical protein A2100_01315 [Sideroxydans sp. GWF2_59_14]|nr:MAG: hypothetical protein A2100_01315 [Sideroxydans sp. GWF2_59_14]HAF44126.1 hypothetical protein [Gallionellaceae bacterium]
MLVIMILGITTVLVGALTGAGQMAANNIRSGEALSQARDALIAYAVSDDLRPGQLICPDVNNDGMVTIGTDTAGTNCASLVGRLPWKSLGIPDLRDSSGERLWYALSDPFHSNGAATLNSETAGTISLSGNVTANNLIAIVFAPGRPLPTLNQGRSVADENTAANYLESILVSPTSFQQLTPNDHEGGAYSYNDQLVYISHDHLLPLVEKRIAREVKKCLDEYANLPSGTPSHKYPWPAPLSTGTYITTPNTLFGRVPTDPTYNIYTPSDPWVIDMLDYIDDLQAALDAYAANNNATTRSNLDTAGDNLNDIADDIIDATTPAYSSEIVTVATPARTAGSRAEHLADGDVGYTVAGVQSKIDSANAALAAIPGSPEDASMSATWPAGCFAAGTYWDQWKSLVFYQIDQKFKPNGTTTACSNDCLSINGSGNPNGGSGNYRAAVVIAGRIVGGQTRAAQTVDQYLELNNQTNKGNTPTNLTFDTYRISDSNFSTLNDQVLCLDGNINCN